MMNENVEKIDFEPLFETVHLKKIDVEMLTKALKNSAEFMNIRIKPEEQFTESDIVILSEFFVQFLKKVQYPIKRLKGVKKASVSETIKKIKEGGEVTVVWETSHDPYAALEFSKEVFHIFIPG